MFVSGLTKSERLWSTASLILLFGVFGVLLYLAVRIALALADVTVNLDTDHLLALLSAAMVYLISHGLRIMRLALLIGQTSAGLRTVASFHMMTAALSLAAPLKLGELYRVVEIPHIAGGFVRGIVIVWLERAFDATVILAMLVLALANTSSAAAQNFLGVAAMAALFISATAIVVFVVPDNLRRLSVFIIRRYEGPQTVQALRAIDLARRSINEAARIVNGKFATIATLTVLIWTCEAVCFAILVPILSGPIENALLALLSFLDALTRGATLLGNLEHGQLESFSANAIPYLMATQFPLAIISLLATVFYIRWRVQQ